MPVEATENLCFFPSILFTEATNQHVYFEWHLKQLVEETSFEEMLLTFIQYPRLIFKQYRGMQ